MDHSINLPVENPSLVINMCSKKPDAMADKRTVIQKAGIYQIAKLSMSFLISI